MKGHTVNTSCTTEDRQKLCQNFVEQDGNLKTR